MDGRHRSRAIAKEKLALREELEARLRDQIQTELRLTMPTVTPSAARVAAKLASVIASQIASLPQANQRALKRIEEDTEEYATEFVAQFAGAAARGFTGQVRKIAVAGDLGMQLPDDWAGPVAGPTILEGTFGIPRSTLHRWRKLNLAIALNTRTSRKPVFPLLQFEDGAPVKGIGSVVGAFASHHKKAWKWLIEPCQELGGAKPIDLLKQGDREAVVTAAQKAGADAGAGETSLKRE